MQALPKAFAGNTRCNGINEFWGIGALPYVLGWKQAIFHEQEPWVAQRLTNKNFRFRNS